MKATTPGLAFELKRESEIIWQLFANSRSSHTRADWMATMMTHFVAGSFAMLLLLEDQDFPETRASMALNREAQI